jgi:chorismate dehydratase
MFKVSIVNYYNTLPFRWALRNSNLLHEIDLQEDIPSICAQKLKYNQVDLALVPVALLPELDNYTIISDYCIGAVGEVDSVKLYSQVDLDQIESITLDYQSKSSITLTQLLAKEFWKINPKYIAAKPGFESEVNDTNAAVIIGDRAFEWNGKYNFEWDLSEQWQLYTGLPFVFAAWVTTKVLPSSFIETFNSILKQGIENIPQAIQQMPVSTVKQMNPLHYLTQRISYNLDEEKKKALQLFISKIKAQNFVV